MATEMARSPFKTMTRCRTRKKRGRPAADRFSRRDHADQEHRPVHQARSHRRALSALCLCRADHAADLCALRRCWAPHVDARRRAADHADRPARGRVTLAAAVGQCADGAGTAGDMAGGRSTLAAGLPWLAPTLVSDKKVVVGPDRVTDWLPFFACPRRIRLAVEREGVCALGGPADFGIVRQYRTQNYGANYTDWTHPLSPYRTDPKGVRFPVHPNPGSRGYRGWLGIWGGGSVEASRSVAAWDDKRRDLEVDPRADVSAWGYDMDNMKACAWVDDRVPWFAFDQPEDRKAWLSRASAAIEAAGVAAAALGLAIRRVRAGVFSRDANGTEQFRVREDASLDLSVDAQSAFWAETEPLFRTWLDKLARAPDDPQQTHLRDWRDGLRHATLALFDRFAGLPEDGDSTPDAMKCWAKARAALDRAFSDHAKAEVTAALKLDIPDTQGGKRRKAKQEPVP
ncbi:type I-E CRISPR-associated protein Cse1/CasA [Hankyongella ginsenosidimutans]|uniref:Type I-E CRISPR-associated protein Cse1/CasA n=2 Tax=Hankyongella ginsenosidimutans TaxID=1763828 RepID=A0A4D7C3K3_9SPHN|nr:type I-E CRISPR-associated protein Cse1/CasA [Hankyongella ginsenosidimutans]